MKLLVGVLVVVGLCLAATAVFAFDESVFPLPGAEQTAVFEWTGAAWVALDPINDHRAECFHVGDQVSYFCNGEYVNDGTAGGIPGQVEVGPWKFTDEASVAQYLEARLSKNGLAWYIAKPYLLAPNSAELPRDWAANSVEIAAKSNGNLRIDFVGFGALQGTDHQDKFIPSYWWLEHAGLPLPPPDSLEWMTGNWSWEIPEDPAHPFMTFHLWNRLHTEKCDSACLYTKTGSVYLVLEEQKPWIPIKLGLKTLPREDP